MDATINIKRNKRGITNNMNPISGNNNVSEIKHDIPKIVKTPFALRYKTITIEDADINGVIYKKDINYLHTDISYHGIIAERIDDDNMPSSYLQVLSKLAKRTAVGGNYCEVTQSELAIECKKNITTINTAIKWLNDNFVIHKIGRSGYIINHNCCTHGSFHTFIKMYKEAYPEDFDI